MIYVLGALLLVSLWHYVQIARTQGGAALGREIARTLVAGLVAGVLLALGARLGMRLIAIANDAAPRISWQGTSAVIAVYSGIGALCAVLYGAVFRRLFRGNGLAYGALLTLATWYPLAHAGAQQLVTPLPLLALALWSGAIVALMFLPYAWVLERLLRVAEKRRAGKTAMVCG
jgi:hypothetical protein